MQFKQMFVTPVCVLFLLKLKWPKSKNFYETTTATILRLQLLYCDYSYYSEDSYYSRCEYSYYIYYSHYGDYSYNSYYSYNGY